MSELPMTLPGEIQWSLRAFASRRRGIALAWRTGLGTLLLMVWLIVACTLDAWGQLGQLTRMISLGLGLILPGILIVGGLIDAMRHRDNWLAIAAMIERLNPALRERLMTVVWQYSEACRERGSEELNAQLAIEVSRLLAGHEPARDLSSRRALWVWVVATACVAGMSGLLLLPDLEVPRLLARQGAPWLDVVPVSATHLHMLVSPTRVAEGGDVAVHVDTSGLGDAKVRLMVSSDGQLFVPMAMEPARRGYIQTLRQVERDLDVYIAGGDARTPVQHVTVLHKPAVREFRIHYEYPAGTHIPPATVHNEDGHIEGPVGTIATVTLLMLEPVDDVRATVGGLSIATRRLDVASTWQFQITLSSDQQWHLQMRGENGLDGSGPGAMTVHVTERYTAAKVLGQWGMHSSGILPDVLSGGGDDPSSADAAFQAYLMALEGNREKRP